MRRQVRLGGVSFAIVFVRLSCLLIPFCSFAFFRFAGGDNQCFQIRRNSETGAQRRFLWVQKAMLMKIDHIFIQSASHRKILISSSKWFRLRRCVAIGVNSM